MPLTMAEQQEANVRACYVEALDRFYENTGQRPRPHDYVPAWDGGRDSSGRLHTPVWPKIIAFCVRHGISPEILIRAAFDAQNRLKPPPPNMLHSEYALAQARGYVSKRQVVTAQSLHYYITQAGVYHANLVAEGRLSNEEAWQQVTYSDPPQLSTMFRYCLACKVGHEGVIHDYEQSALRDYVWLRDVYDAVWKDWIPERLRLLADAAAEETIRRVSQQANELRSANDSNQKGWS